MVLGRWLNECEKEQPNEGFAIRSLDLSELDYLRTHLAAKQFSNAAGQTLRRTTAQITIRHTQTTSNANARHTAAAAAVNRTNVQR